MCPWGRAALLLLALARRLIVVAAQAARPAGGRTGRPLLVGANLGLLLVVLPQQRRAKAGGPGALCGALCASPHTLPAHCPLRLATACLPRSCACPKGRRAAAAPVRACAVKLRALLLLRLLLPPPGGRVG